MTKIPNKINWRKERLVGLVWGYWPIRVYLEATRAEAWDVWTHCLCWQEAQRNESWCSLSFSAFHVVQDPNPQNGAAHSQVCLPTSVNLIWTVPYRHAQKHLSLVILNPQKLSLSINHHTVLWSNGRLAMLIRVPSPLLSSEAAPEERWSLPLDNDLILLICQGGNRETKV